MASLTLIPTPLGNLEDITLRAIRMLKEADLILAEDTRKTAILLRHFDIHKPMLSHHQFNEHKTVELIAARIESGENIALVSDAGTPGISDPGFLLVRACLRRGIDVCCLPGPTALIPALVASGLPCDRFRFEGFLPHKKGRATRLAELAALKNTFVLYESPFRLLKTLEQLAAACGGHRKACVARELTKIYEEIKRGSLDELVEFYREKSVKGEIVIVVGATDHEDYEDNSEEEENSL